MTNNNRSSLQNTAAARVLIVDGREIPIANPTPTTKQQPQIIQLEKLGENIIKFPKPYKIHPNVDDKFLLRDGTIIYESDLPEDMIEWRHEQKRRYIEDMIDDFIGISVRELKNFGFPIQASEEQYKMDLAFFRMMVQGIIYRQFGLPHHTHEYLNTGKSVTNPETGESLVVFGDQDDGTELAIKDVEEIIDVELEEDINDEDDIA